MSTFDIFLVPKTSQYKKYDKIINSFAVNYRTPSFPHVTLLNLVEGDESVLVNKVKIIAQNFNKIEVEIFGVNFTNTVTQCVFAQIKMSVELLNLYKELETGLNYHDKTPFMPHMSLIYGDLSSELKSKLAKSIKIGKKLLLDKVVIYSDGPSASDWRHIAEFGLI